MNTDNSKKCTEDIQAAIYHIQHTEVFMCGLIQELNMRLDPNGPPAYIGYDKKNMKFVMGFNPNRFVKWTKLQQADVLKHEVMHFLNKHLIRFKEEAETVNTIDQMIKNIAADMAINQYLPNIPYGCEECKDKDFKYQCTNKECSGKSINIKDWKDKNGNLLAPYKTYEHYFGEIKESLKDQYKKQQKGDKSHKGPNDDTMKAYKPFDEHDWEALSEDEKERMLAEAKGLIKRTLEKTSYDHSMIPGSVKDLLEELDSQLQRMDYKGILRRAIKKTVAVTEREANWKRPNRRYGYKAPGTTVGKLPNIVCYADSSGSISQKEFNQMLTTIDGFLKVGNKRTWLGLWHTELYLYKKRKLFEEFNGEWVESGGTDADAPLKHIIEFKPDLALILTDGCFSETNLNIPKNCEVIWIITPGNDINHPNKKIGKTIKMEALS